MLLQAKTIPSGTDPAGRHAGAAGAAPHNQVRPTAIFVIALLAALVLDANAPLPSVREALGPWIGWLGVTAIAAGAVLTTICLMFFGRVGTGIMPDRPARRLVTSGPYRWSRNPMFVGFGLVHAGAALTLDSLWALLALPVAIAITTRTVIGVEEAYMRRRFGAEYDAYAARVRRWLGRRPARQRQPWPAGRSVGIERPRSSPSGPRHTLTP
jgi:protein-S-isoprenylcysteine O-methyltransferase Ste14